MWLEPEPTNPKFEMKSTNGFFLFEIFIIDCLSSASTFRQGSVVVSFNVSYAAVDALQIVTMQEQIESGGTLGDSPAVLINISSNYGKEVLSTQTTLCPSSL